MNIQEIKERKKILEHFINKMVNEFASETGTEVVYINLEKLDITTHQREVILINSVNVEVRVP
jgi:ribosomal protein L13